MPELLDELLEHEFTFQPRPKAIPCEIRPVWRMYAVALMVEKCWGSKASFEQLHVLNWAMRTRESRSAFLQFLDGKRSPNQTIVRFDPALNRAVQFAFADKVVEKLEKQMKLIEDDNDGDSAAKYRIVLAPKGIKMVKHVRSMDDCFEEEKAFLDSIPSKITQKQVAMLFTWGTK